MQSYSVRLVESNLGELSLGKWYSWFLGIPVSQFYVSYSSAPEWSNIKLKHLINRTLQPGSLPNSRLLLERQRR